MRPTGTEWANLSGEYRRDLSDYIELCVPCHRLKDSGGIKHGTSTGYDYYRCRCQFCKKANAVRKSDERRRKRQEITHR